MPDFNVRQFKTMSGDSQFTAPQFAKKKITGIKLCFDYIKEMEFYEA